MPINIINSDRPSAEELKAASALQSRLANINEECSFEIFIGTAALARGGTEFADATLKAADSYCIRQTTHNGKTAVLLAGRGNGVVYAAYAWLEHQGWSFHLHADIEPETGRLLDLADFALAKQPRFAWRGLQLWNYWWPGRDSWDFAEYAAYLDQFPKLGLNHFEFPLYWHEPLFTGVRFAGAPLRRLPLSGADVRLARIGADALASQNRFTSADIPEDGSDDERTAAAQNLLRRIFRHAKSVGLRTTIGLEPSNVMLIDPSLLGRLPPEDLYEGGLLVQPSSKTGRGLARARLQALFETVPDADVYAIWQTEMGVVRNTPGSPHPHDVAFRAQYAQFADRLSPGDFDQLQWLRIAAEIAAQLKPDARLATGGWGAERLILAADATLPPDMIRATIADYEPEFGLR